MLIDTDALSMAQRGPCGSYRCCGHLGEEGLQEIMGGIGGDFLADKAEATGDAVDMSIHRRNRSATVKK
jgi:hypothetical protein